jgi:long-chain acyl-CoA synthetase
MFRPALTGALDRARRIAGGHTAVIFAERRQTWSAFAERVTRLAGTLRGLGLEADGRVAVLGHSSDRYIEAFFGILWAGGIIVPVSTRYALPETAFLLQDSGAEILLVGDEFHAMVPDLRRLAPGIRHVVHMGELRPPADMIDYEAALAGAAPCPDAGRGGDDVAILFYTGGTTGRSKGVMLTHANCFANSQGSIMHMKLDERVVGLHAGPLYHAAAGSRVFTNTILAGTHVVIPRFTVATVLEAIERHRVTMTSLVPTMMTMLLNDPALEAHDLSSLDLLAYGGAPMPVATLEALIRRLPGVRFGQAYGMTELSPACTFLEPQFHTLDPENIPRLASGGRAGIGIDVRIVDGEDRELPRGEIGEIIVAGPIVMKGYWKQPELTAEALRGGFMHTGDLGHMDEDGFVYVVDRLKDMIVTGGENVYSVEVENAVQTHPAVRECAVFGIPHDLWGEAVHAAVVLKQGAAVEAEALMAHCRDRIAAFKCPRSIDFLQALPLSAANKILKSELRRPFWDGRARRVN